MREILFRGKCIDETFLKGQWLEGQILHDGVTGKYYIHRDNCLNESDNVGEEGLLRFVAYEIAHETVCQYTGLTDKNGGKIFEGDILRSDDNKIGQVQWFEEHSAFMIWNNTENKVYFLYDNDFSKIEVIGNIFDNTELIGDQP